MTTTEPTLDRSTTIRDHSRATMALRIATVLWLIWGVFHVVAGVGIVAFLYSEHPTGELEAIPGALDVEFFGLDSTFASIATMQQHGYNLAWIGVIVTIAAVGVWRANALRWQPVCSWAGWPISATSSSSTSPAMQIPRAPR